MKLLAPFAVLATTSTIASGFAPALLVKSPLLLIALSPLPRHLAMVAADVPLLPFYLIAVTRLFIGDPFMYLLGREFGDDGIAYLAGKMGSGGKLLTRFDKAARRFSWLLVFVWPSPLFCALAGAARIRPLPFVLLSLMGTLNMVTIIRLFGESFAGPLLALRRFFEQHTVAATAVTIALVALTMLLQRSRPEPEEAPGIATAEDDSSPPGG